MTNEYSMINLGELSKPASLLIEKISDAVGGFCRPWQIRRVAKADAEAALIQEEAQIQITELHRRALHRFLEEEAQKQDNIERITADALPHLDDEADPTGVESDWVANFFDKCRISSDSEMQQLWSRVLAGEANHPGAFSRRTVNLIADLDKRDAEMFRTLCRFCWEIGRVTPIVYNLEDDIYSRYGVKFDSLLHLESLGLVQFDSLSGFVSKNLPRSFDVRYFGEIVSLVLPEDRGNQLSIGKVLLTKAGLQLAPICMAEPIPEVFEYMCKIWESKGFLDGSASESAG